MKIAVIYHSKTGVTGQLAQAIIEGIKEQSNDTFILEYSIHGKEIIEGRFINHELFEQLLDCDAIIMGSPTYMGNISAQFKSFADASGEYWMNQRWANKVAAGFTSGGAINGDQANSIQYLSTFASQHGMLWVGLDVVDERNGQNINRLGFHQGVIGNIENKKLHETDLRTATYLGNRVATFAAKLN